MKTSMLMPPKWVGLPERLLELEVPRDAVFVALVRRSRDALGAVSSLLQTNSLLGDPKAFSSWINASGISRADISHVRIVGAPASVKIMEGLFTLFGVRVERSVALADVSTVLQFIPSDGRIRVQKAETPRPSELKVAPVRVLVVDDSESIRKLLQNIISKDPGLQFVGAVARPSEVEGAINRLKPDVLTLDIHMPEMTGVELLKQFMPKTPLPVVMITSLSKEEGSLVLDALEAGAIDYLQKPSLSELDDAAPRICEKIKAAASARVRKVGRSGLHHLRPLGTGSVDVNWLCAIGSSTGGTEALKELLTMLPEKIPPIVIVQHIPAVFSKALADRLNELCPFEVREAQDGDLLQSSRVLIAPGGYQMRVRAYGSELRAVVEDADPVNRHKPSVDVLFASVADLRRPKVSGVILTGMGGDGAQGLLKLRQTGARTFSQDEASCVVYGMPREAVRIGASETVLSLSSMPDALVGTWSGVRRAA